MARQPDSDSRPKRRTNPALLALALLAAGIWQFVTSSAKSATLRAPVGKVRIQRENPNTAIETSDWALLPVAIIYVGILVLLTVACLALIAGFPHAFPDVSRVPRISPPAPRLLTNAPSEFQRVRSEEEARLNTYYWIDRSKGVVHIPIEQAMQKLANKGILGFPKGNP